LLALSIWGKSRKTCPLVGKAETKHFLVLHGREKLADSLVALHEVGNQGDMETANLERFRFTLLATQGMYLRSHFLCYVD
jgi:hypothetical protein